MLQLLEKIIGKGGAKETIYRFLYACCLIIHTLFAIIFFTLDVTQLAIFNTGSVILYLAGCIFINSKKTSPVWLGLLFAEIVAHDFLCTVMLGWNFGFSFFGLLIIPAVYYVTFIDDAITHPAIFATILSVIDISLMFVSYFFEGVLYKGGFPHELEQLISCLNMLITAVTLIAFSFLFVYNIRKTMSNLSQKNKELDFLANYDALTHLRNRHHIADQFHIYEQDTKPYCVILGDIDDFKRINDTYSHDCGDKVLVNVADTISGGIGERGTVCRWGGEEILIIMSGTSDECYEIMENIRLKIQNMNLSFNRREIKVTMTFGFSDYSEAMNIEKLVSVADSRLYKGKRNGKNQVVYHQYDRKDA